ncbi:MAG: VanW family protein [Promicromonosporaceae bacterium]|nr:VanW family protein [Promicromonosporaceae bacterium]
MSEPANRAAPQPAAPSGVPTLALPAVAPPQPAQPAPPAQPEPAAEPTPLPDAETTPDAPRRRGRRALLWSAAGVVALGGAYAGAQWYVADRVPTGTSVAGVAVGGKLHHEAVAALDAGLTERAGEHLTLAAATATAEVHPSDAGLALDTTGTVDGLTGFSLHPARLWAHLSGGSDVAPAITVDRDALDAAAAGLAEKLHVEPVDGSVGFAEGAAVTTPATAGSSVTADDVAAAIEAGWLRAAGPLGVPSEQVEPEITQEATDAAYALAQHIAGSPVTVEVGSQTAELPGSVLASAVSFEAVEGELVPSFDGDAIRAAVAERTSGLLANPVEARFQFVEGRPQITGGTPGTTFDTAQLAAAVHDAAVGDDRVARVDVVEQAPATSRADLEALGVREVVSSFSTGLTNDAVRTGNIRRGAELITGTLIRPGETFSLLGALGPVTTANGFGNAPMIVNGQFVPGVGGGLSQLATNVYNVGFFAGFEDVEHRPHSVWIPRYPAGREATIATGSIDTRFRNNSPHGAVVRAWVGGGQLHVQLWSTHHFRVESWQSPKTNIRPAETVPSSAPGCTPRSRGQDGFTITNGRRVFRGSTLVIDESNTWTYRPDHGTSCAPPPQQHAPEAPQDGGDEPAE